MKWERLFITGTNYTETVLAISKNELPALRNATVQAINRLQPRYDKLKDIHEIGEATEKQRDKMCALANELDQLKNFLKYTN